jgi:hypothetical protein
MVNLVDNPNSVLIAIRWTRIDGNFYADVDVQLPCESNGKVSAQCKKRTVIEAKSLPQLEKIIFEIEARIRSLFQSNVIFYYCYA